MTIFMLSLGGIPPTAGFFGKFYVFRAALEKPALVWLVVIAVLNSVVSVFYYLRVVTAMYFREVGREAKPLRATSVSAALLIAAIGVLAHRHPADLARRRGERRRLRPVSAAPLLQPRRRARSPSLSPRSRTRASTASRSPTIRRLDTQCRQNGQQTARIGSMNSSSRREAHAQWNFKGRANQASGGPSVTVQRLRVAASERLLSRARPRTPASRPRATASRARRCSRDRSCR